MLCPEITSLACYIGNDYQVFGVVGVALAMGLMAGFIAGILHKFIKG